MASSHQRNILDINDDCFYLIYDYLSVIDWCSLRETCTRFRTISDYCFERRSKTFDLRNISDTSYPLDVSEVKRVLRNFGRFMNTLSISESYFNRPVDCSVLMPFLDRYCGSLLDLKLVHFNLTLPTIVQCGRLFSNLQRLVVDQWEDKGTFSGCLTKCASLTELELVDLQNVTLDSSNEGRMEYLESFKMSRCSSVSYEEFKHFLTRHSQLTQVKLFDLRFGEDIPDVHSMLGFVAKTLPKLEALSLHLNRGFMLNLLPVAQMTSLRKLEVNAMYVADSDMNQVLSRMAVQNAITDLHLAQFKLTDDSIRLLSSLKCLKILKLTGANQLNVDICKRLATQLSGLEEIHIVECRDTIFGAVKEFVEHVPNLRKIVFNRTDDSLSVTQEMFASLVKIRKRQATSEILCIFLNDDNLREIRNEFKWSGVSDALAKHANVLKLLPLEKEHRNTVYEYGSGFTLRTGRNFSNIEHLLVANDSGDIEDLEDVDDSGDIEDLEDADDSDSDESDDYENGSGSLRAGPVRVQLRLSSNSHTAVWNE